MPMMPAGTGSSVMASDYEQGSMQHYEQIFSRVNVVSENTPAARGVQNPEKASASLEKQKSSTTQDGEFEVVKTVVTAPKKEEDDGEF